jgi:spoIIIJ-associated protein
MDYSEKWGKDVDEAVKLALNDLKVSRDEVEVIVLEEPVRGFLGIGAKLAKVRVEKKKAESARKLDAVEEHPSYARPAAEEERPKPPADAPTQGGIHGAEAREGSLENDVGAFVRPTKNKVRDLRKKKPENADDKDRSRPRPESGGDSGRRERSDGQRGRDGRRDGGRSDGRRSESRNDNRRDSRPEARRDSRQQPVDGRLRRDKPAPRHDRGQDEAFSSDDGDFKLAVSERPQNLRPVADGNEADIFFRKLMEKMLLDVNVRSFENEECVYLEVDGKDSRTVIGKRGQTLDAIQYLTNLVMNKNQENYVRVIVDVEGYRSRRERTLEHLAVKLARKVEKTGKGMRLEPMNPYERKVIHSTLQSNPRICTRSEGEEPYRRVIIERK